MRDKSIALKKFNKTSIFMQPTPKADYTTTQFSYFKDKQSLSVFASDIDFLPEYAFSLQSHKSGKVVICKHVKTHRDRDNDITHYEYDCSHHKIKKVIVFND